MSESELLDLRHADQLTAELAGLIAGVVDAVEDGVQIDPGGKAAIVVVAQRDVFVACAEQLQ